MSAVRKEVRKEPGYAQRTTSRGIEFLVPYKRICELEAAEAEHAKAIALLRGIEWSDGHWSVNVEGGGCPCCSNGCRQGHAADCELAALISTSVPPEVSASPADRGDWEKP